MLVHIGLFVYLLVKTCSYGSLGATVYPLADNDGQRRIIQVCTEYGPDQTKQVFVHELIHACLHNHLHHYKTKADLEKEVSTIPDQPEELFVQNLAYCMTPVLGDKDVFTFLGISSSDSQSSGGRKTNSFGR